MNHPLENEYAVSPPQTPLGAPPPEMVQIPEGIYQFGPGRIQQSLGEFAIDRFPVTNDQYLRTAEKFGLRIPELLKDASFMRQKGRHPIVGIQFREALAFCQCEGFDLPTENEWEKAARGKDGRLYPWGDQFDNGRCNTKASGIRDTTPVDYYKNGASEFDIYDMIGNVWEWTSTASADHFIRVKGGSWFDPPALARCDRASTARLDYQCSSIGFRRVWRPALRPAAALPSRRMERPPNVSFETAAPAIELSSLFEVSNSAVSAVQSLADETGELCNFTKNEIDDLIHAGLAETTGGEPERVLADLETAVAKGDFASARVALAALEAVPAMSSEFERSRELILIRARQMLANAESWASHGGMRPPAHHDSFGFWLRLSGFLMVANAVVFWARATGRL
ncbi:MAG: formylglycine-generating enzyme family protein [Planctomycetota bacterium]